MTLLTGTSHAGEELAQRVEIPAGDLGQSLEVLSRQFGIQILFDADRLKGVRSSAVSGLLTAGKAIDRLLVGTSLTEKVGPEDSYLITTLSVPATNAPFANPEATRPRVDTPLDEVIVTGTHIRGEIPVGASLSTYERDDFDKLGNTTVDSLARSMIENFSGADSLATINTNGNVGSLQQGAANNIFGGAGFDLLGLGPRATLTLVDGHRIAPGGLDGSMVDVSLIPLSAIDHVEVLTDGSSAIYGSDAVAGVVNIVTRRILDGVETNLRYGQSTEGGAGDYTASQLLGHGWSSGHALFDYEYHDEQGLDASQRRWIGSEGGPYSLVPENRRQSLFLTGTQSLADTAFSFTNLYSSRAFRLDGIQLSTSGFVPNSEIGAGHANLESAVVTVEHEFPADWQASSTALYSSMNQWRNGQEFPDGLAGNSFNSALLADSEVSSIDVSGSGRVLRLPAGALRVALGGGFRLESFRGSIPSIEPLPTISEDRTDLNTYAEFMVPLFGERWAWPGLRRLTMSFAYRADSYSHFGAPANEKWGWIWEPMAGLSVRGTFGTSFRTPLISQLDATTTSYTTLLPSATPGGKPTDALVVNGGSPTLQPEKSKSFTTGIDWAPLRWPGIGGSVTYFNVNYNNRIQSQNIDAMPLAAQTQLFSITGVNPSLAQVLPLFQAPNFQQDGAGLGPAGVTAIIYNQPANAETTVEQGVRLDGRYHYEAGRAGSLEFTVAGNYLLVDRTSIDTYFPQSTNVADTIAEPPKLRLRGAFTWQYRSLTADILVNHSSAYQNALFSPAQTIGSWTTADLGLQFHVPSYSGGLARDLTVFFNIQNLADRRPPFVAIPAGDVAVGRSPVPFDGTNASIVGRYLAVGIRAGW